jgi:copper chaperone
MQTITLSIDGMSCGHCVASVRKALGTVPGLEIRDVRIGSAELALDGTVTPVIDAALAAVQDAGYEAAVVATSPTGESSSVGGTCCTAGAKLTALSSSRTR